MITGQYPRGIGLTADLTANLIAGQAAVVTVESDHDRRDALNLALAAASAQAFDQAHGERVRVVVTEMATNLVQHATSGRIFVRLLEHGDCKGVELVATDLGPGMSDMNDASGMSHGSTSGAASLTSGLAPPGGLGTIARVSNLFDLYSAPGRGTVMVARLWGGMPPDAGDGQFRIGCMAEAIPGELVSGDAWAVEQSGTRVVALVSDGLGHGVAASAASVAAVAAFRRWHQEPVEDIVGHIHRALLGTRGAAIAVAEVDPGAGRLRFCGIGNIAARLFLADKEKYLVSHFGIAGYQIRRIRAFDEPWDDGAMLVMHSDGLSPTWDLRTYSGIFSHHPQLAAATVMRDAPRANDDTVVLALQDSRRATATTTLEAC